jgi:hypothetical protein
MMETFGVRNGSSPQDPLHQRLKRTELHSDPTDALQRGNEYEYTAEAPETLPVDNEQVNDDCDR